MLEAYPSRSHLDHGHVLRCQPPGDLGPVIRGEVCRELRRAFSKSWEMVIDSSFLLTPRSKAPNADAASRIGKAWGRTTW